jgi:lysophospholipase L1-like esterase
VRLALATLLLLSQGTPERIVFLGDSITDGHTLPLLVEQALKTPRCINAGVAGDTAAGMRKRLERDVLPLRPALVALSVGINDVLRQVTPEAYERDVVAISDRLKQEGIPMLLLTPTILGPKHSEAEKRLADYIVVLRRLAERERYAVANVHTVMHEGRTAGKELLEPDQVHLSFEGYRVMARAVLDALGRQDAAVPAKLALEPLPGIVREWKVRALPDGEWKALALPQTEPHPHWWHDQERRRGFAIDLGPAKRYEAEATLALRKSRGVFLSTGAAIESIALNGRELWKSTGWTGWHAGKERIAATLEAGTNTIRIECGNAFFLSITDENPW